MMQKKILAVLTVWMLALAPLTASALGPDQPEPSVGSKILDVALVRPFAMLGSFVTSGVFFGTLPITFFTGVGTQSARYLVMTPWRFTVARYVGDFQHYVDGRSASDRLLLSPRSQRMVASRGSGYVGGAAGSAGY